MTEPTNSRAQAAADKAYAKAERPWYKKKRFAIPLALVALGIIGSAFGAEEATTDDSASTSQESTASDEGSKDTADKPKAKPKPKPKKKVVKATAAEMIKAFEENELAADDKYKGKRIQVSGVVDKIDTEVFDSGDYILRIGTGSEFDFLTVNCEDMSKKELSTLNTGDDVKAVGQFKDGGDLGVDLKKCELV